MADSETPGVDAFIEGTCRWMERDGVGEVCHSLDYDGLADFARGIARRLREMTQERDDLIHDNARLIQHASEETQRAFEAERAMDEALRDAGQRQKALSILASIWHWGSFKAETHNEHELEKIMRSLKLWPHDPDAAIDSAIGAKGV